VIFPVVYAVLVWSIAMHWRRRWPAFVAVAVGVIALLLLYSLVHAWDGAFPPHYRHIFLLFWPYTILIGLMGFYIACLPRRAQEHECQKCCYDLRGLNPKGLSCPECGETFKGQGSGLEPPEPTLIPIPRGAPRDRTVL
jgi:hypothetical protein